MRDHICTFFWDEFYYRKLECSICGRHLNANQILETVNTYYKKSARVSKPKESNKEQIKQVKQVDVLVCIREEFE